MTWYAAAMESEPRWEDLDWEDLSLDADEHSDPVELLGSRVLRFRHSWHGLCDSENVHY